MSKVSWKLEIWLGDYVCGLYSSHTQYLLVHFLSCLLFVLNVCSATEKERC